MSDFFECCVMNSLGLTPSAPLLLGELLGASFELDSTRDDLDYYRDWAAPGFDLDVNREFAVLCNFTNWWGFCTDFPIRRKCLQNSLSLAEAFKSDNVVLVPEEAGSSIAVMDGWKWQQLLEDLACRYGVPASLDALTLFAQENFPEKETDETECYFHLSTSELRALIHEADEILSSKTSR